MQSPIVTLSSVGEQGWSAGPKAANLRRLFHAGFRVPDGFAIGYEALDAHLQASGLTEKARQHLLALDDCQLDNLEEVNAGAQRIRELIQSVALPDDLSRDIVDSWQALGGGAVSVRSSSSLEDRGSLSFAGQHDTFLNVVNENQLVDAVKDVWASAYTDRAVTYLKTLRISLLETRMGVIVQTMVNARSAGVAFSIHPVTGNRDQIQISASYGLGESVVSGAVTPDEVVLKKSGLEVADYHVGAQSKKLIADDAGGLREVDASTEESNAHVLSDEELKTLGALVCEVESLMDNNPQDVEWAQQGDDFFLLQTRPLVQLNDSHQLSWESPVPGAHWKRNWRLGEWIPDAVTPLFATWILPAMVASREEFGTGALGWKDMDSFSMPKPWFSVINGYFYTRQDFPEHMQSATLEERLARMTRSRGRIKRWREESLPAYVTHFNEEVKGKNLDEMNNDALLAFVDQLVAEAGEFWSFIAPIGYGFEEMVFKPLYEKVIPGEKPHYSLLFSGYESRMTDAQVALWELAESVKADADLLTYITQAEPADIDLQDDARLPDWFVEAVNQYDADYGHQVLSLDIFWPTLGESPVHTLSSIKALASASVTDPRKTMQTVQQQREAAVAEVLERLSDQPEKRSQFAETIAFYQGNAAVRENCNFYLQIGWPLIRGAIHRLAQRLIQAGVLENVDEIFFLQKDELFGVLTEFNQSAHQKTPQEKNVTSLSHVSRGRRKTWESQRQLNAPDSIPVVASEVDIGWHAEKGELRCLGVSPGQATGPVKRVINEADAREFRRGDVLVIKAASPLFTPLMLMAAGLVVEVGGGASHSSLVAREIGLPGVANASNATEHFEDGQEVMVDGTAGLVKILSGENVK